MFSVFFSIRCISLYFSYCHYYCCSLLMSILRLWNENQIYFFYSMFSILWTKSSSLIRVVFHLHIFIFVRESVVSYLMLLSLFFPWNDQTKIYTFGFITYFCGCPALNFEKCLFSQTSTGFGSHRIGNEIISDIQGLFRLN